MQFIDKPFADTMALVSPEHAYLAGRIKTDQLEELRNFQRAFPFNPTVVIASFQELARRFPDANQPPSDQERIAFAFEYLLPRIYSPKSVGDWEGVLHFTITDRDARFTVAVDGEKAEVSRGLNGTPTAEISMDHETYRAVLRYTALEDSTMVSAEQLADWETQEELASSELSDDQLEAVAGGKGCGAEASAQTACGADSAGGSIAVRTACGAAACGGAVGGYTACGADACGVAASIGTVCGAAACPAAAGVGTACGADAGVGACAGNVCGAAVGAGVCAGNACGVDVLGGADVGPCAINIIPCCPFI
jgi:hypothetical protein